MMSFARDIGARVIAEGIEIQEELQTLRDLGVPSGQGFHLARPRQVPADEGLAGTFRDLPIGEG